jgi:hypothetical protein
VVSAAGTGGTKTQGDVLSFGREDDVFVWSVRGDGGPGYQLVAQGVLLDGASDDGTLA